ncbi:MAG: PTS sugar transporter subunit IIA [Candidatus Omnitrophota bacterium]
MNEGVKVIKIFVSSPSDVIPERERLAIVVDELNRSICPKLNVSLQLMRWETDVTPSMGRPQQVILDQIGQYDIFIGIMWKRFGTPTGKAASGTREEFDEAYKLWKGKGRPKIMFYFSKMPYVMPSIQEVEQLKQVIEFRKELEQSGLIWDFTGPEQFERYVRGHLIDTIYEILRKDKEINDVLLLSLELNVPPKMFLDKYKVMKKIVAHIAQSVDFSYNDVLEQMLNRETMNSTGLNAGIALPHGYGTLYPKHIAAIIRSSEGIEWQTIDDQPVFTIIMLLYAQHRRGAVALRVMNALARTAIFFERKKEGSLKTAPLSDIVNIAKEELKEKDIYSIEYKQLPILMLNSRD